MTGGPIRSVTIVGGGTAGWTTAGILNHKLNLTRPPGRPPIAITLIESPRIPTIGVGEATVPSMPNMLYHLGVKEDVFFRRCNASFKLGVRFVDWARDRQDRPITFLHPFNTPKDIAGRSPADYYAQFGPVSLDQSLGDCVLPNDTLIDHKRAPRNPGDPDYRFAVGYAYHMDAALYAQFMKEIHTGHGVTLIRDDVIDATRDEAGNIAGLRLLEGGDHPVELLIDCTGFRGLFIQGALEEPFESYSDALLCDRALALQIPHAEASDLEPCTRSTALGAGWSWRVPLFSRVGTGYVFSSAHRSDDEAADEFLGFLKSRGERIEGAEPRAIAMRIGRSRRGWVKNCVAVGLAGGFIEPLESTAIYMIENAASWVCKYFPYDGLDERLPDGFNALMGDLQEEIRDFIVMHYVTSNRQGPFWEAARNEVTIPDGLKANLERWRHRHPRAADLKSMHLFGDWSYLLCLQARDYFKDMEAIGDPALRREDWVTYSRELARHKHALVGHLKDHHTVLSAIRERGAADPAAFAADASSAPQAAPIP